MGIGILRFLNSLCIIIYALIYQLFESHMYGCLFYATHGYPIDIYSVACPLILWVHILAVGILVALNPFPLPEFGLVT